MSDRPSSRKASRRQPFVDRRVASRAAAPDDAADTLRKVKGALGRPLGIERKDGHVRVVLVERRRTPPADQPPMLARICRDLRGRLVDLADSPAERLMRHVAFVGTELARKGWSGVEALPASVLAKALVQAEMLASEEPSEPLSIFIDRLRLLKAGAEVREERMTTDRRELDDATLVVSEATHEEFEASQRIWADSLAADLANESSRGNDPA
jgi:hypothetical protein